MTYYKNDGSEHGNDRFSFKDTDNTVEYLVNVTVNLINDPPSFAKADKVRDPLTALNSSLSQTDLWIPVKSFQTDHWIF